MKVVATSDLHGDLPDIPDCDLLVVAGDVCPIDNHDTSAQALWLVAEFRPWLLSQPVGDAVFIGGNHDFICETDGFEVEPDKFGATYLQDSKIEIGGASVWGTPWIPNLTGWAFHAPVERSRNRFRKIPEGTDIVVSHGPVSGIMDDVNGQAVGCPILASNIQRVSPAVFICGHIHECGGQIETIGKTTFINASRMDENYKPVHKPVEFNMELGESGWQVTW